MYDLHSNMDRFESGATAHNTKTLDSLHSNMDRFERRPDKSSFDIICLFTFQYG